MQHPYDSNMGLANLVSILTRPGGRVQHFVPHVDATQRTSFNPHPSRRTGATGATCGSMMWRILFQSSPVPEDGCNPTVG